MMIPEGRYKARGTEGALAKTNDGNGQVAVDIVITEEGEYEGQHRTWYGHFTEKTTERTLQSLRFMGWEGDDLSDLAGIDRNDVWVTITHEEDLEGVLRDRVAWVNASPGLGVKSPMDEGEAKAFAERMKGHVLAQKAKSGGSSPNAKPAAAGSGGSKPSSGGAKKKSPPATAPKTANDFAPEDGDAPF